MAKVNKGSRLIAERRLTPYAHLSLPMRSVKIAVFSNPHDRNMISLETALILPDQAKDCGMGQVVFTGGEVLFR